MLQVGERLGRYEVEKRCAVEKEDYDLAKEKKRQMEQYRLRVYQQLQLHDLAGAELVGAATHPSLALTHPGGGFAGRVEGLPPLVAACLPPPVVNQWPCPMLPDRLGQWQRRCTPSRAPLLGWEAGPEPRQQCRAQALGLTAWCTCWHLPAAGWLG